MNIRSHATLALVVSITFFCITSSHAESSLGLKLGLSFPTKAYENCVAQKTALAYAVCDLDAQVSAKSRTIASLNGRLSNCQATVATLAKQLRQKDDELKKKQEEVDGLKKELAETEAALAATERQLAETKILLQQCEQRKAELDRELRELNDKYVASIEEKGELKGELAEIKISRDGYKKDADTARHHLEYLKTLFRILAACLALCLALLLISLFRWHHYRHHHWELHRREDHAKDEIIALREKNTETDRENKALVAENAEARRQHERDLDQIRKLSSDYSGMNSELVVVKGQVHDLKQSNMQLSCWFNECKSGRAYAEKEAAVAQANVVGATREMAAAKCNCDSHTAPVFNNADKTFGAPTVTPVTPTTPSTPSNATPLADSSKAEPTKADGSAQPTKTNSGNDNSGDDTFGTIVKVAGIVGTILGFL